jgi:hypothetical protein
LADLILFALPEFLVALESNSKSKDTLNTTSIPSLLILALPELIYICKYISPFPGRYLTYGTTKARTNLHPTNHSFSVVGMGGFRDFSCFRFATDVEENKAAKKPKSTEPAAAAGTSTTAGTASKALPSDVSLPAATETATTYSSWIRRPKVPREGVGLHRRSRSGST